MNIKRLHLKHIARHRSKFETYFRNQCDLVEWRAPGLNVPVIREDPCIVIFGPVKSGKSTLARLIQRYRPRARIIEKPTARHVRIERQNGVPLEVMPQDILGADLAIMTLGVTQHGIEAQVIKSRWHRPSPGHVFLIPCGPSNRDT